MRGGANLALKGLRDRENKVVGGIIGEAAVAEETALVPLRDDDDGRLVDHGSTWAGRGTHRADLGKDGGIDPVAGRNLG